MDDAHDEEPEWLNRAVDRLVATVLRERPLGVLLDGANTAEPTAESRQRRMRHRRTLTDGLKLLLLGAAGFALVAVVWAWRAPGGRSGAGSRQLALAGEEGAPRGAARLNLHGGPDRAAGAGGRRDTARRRGRRSRAPPAPPTR